MLMVWFNDPARPGNREEKCGLMIQAHGLSITDKIYAERGRTRHVVLFE